MSNNQPHSSEPIDAEYEPAETGKEDSATAKETRVVKRGPGWFSFFLLFLVMLGTLGFTAWSTGLIQRTELAQLYARTGLPALPDPATQTLPDAENPEMENLRATQSGLETQVSDLSTQLGALETRLTREIEQLRTQAADRPVTQEGDETQASPALEALQSEQAALGERLDELAEEISSQDAQAAEAVEALRTQQASPGEQVEKLSSQMAGLDDRLASETERIAEMAASDGGNESDQRAASLMQLARLQDRLGNLEQQVTQLGNEAGDTMDPARLETIETRLDEAQDDNTAADEQLGELRTELKTLRSDLETFKAVQQDFTSQLASIQESGTDTTGDATALVRASLALSAIEAAVQRGEAFPAAHARLRDARPGDALVDDLASFAGTPVPTLDSLKSDFRDLQDTSSPATASEASNDGWIGNIFGDAVSVRQTNKPSSAQPARFEEAQAALARNDLSAAIGAVEGLPATQRQAFAMWLENARKRVRLEETLEDLRLKLTASAP
ncbi:hypothetical protein [Henriciella sp.]|uniref:COG4223 family protein n=1 Tax=Henriciella sp. TaxID=1968823 RepID=UPI00260B25A8|nr:hypothetical protein [Henriciella sp.]